MTGNTSDNEIPELRARFALQDFFVDLLGGLVPGLLFILGLSFSLLPVLLVGIAIVLGTPRVGIGAFFAGMLSATRETPSAIWIAGLFVLVAIAYVVGHLFYRKGPKEPDQRSFGRITKGEDADKLRAEYGCASQSECAFPYPNMDLYLKQRGHDHLLPLVLWREGSSYRSKTYINLLKIRLRYFHPEKCSEVIKNEAHVRLSSSTWFVTRALRYCCWVALALGFALMLVAWAVLVGAADPSAHLVSFLDVRALLAICFLPAAVLLLAEFGRVRIEEILHYQRMREVFFVLETAYTAFRDHPEALDPPFSGFVEAMAKQGAQNHATPPVG